MRPKKESIRRGVSGCAACPRARTFPSADGGDIKEALYEATEHLEKIFSTTHLAIAYLDTAFNFIRVNQAYAEANGYSPAFLAGKNHFDVYPDERHLRLFRKVLESGKTYCAYSQPFRCANGRRGVAYWDWSLHPVRDSSGTTEGLLMCLVNVTERKLAENALARTRKRLEDAKRLSDVGILAMTVAHELRNPLGVIRAAAYNMRKNDCAPALEGRLSTIEKKILECDRIIKNLLFYSRIRMPQFEAMRICDILDECVESAADKFKGWDVRVEKKYDAIRADFAEADAVQIRELFGNILDNAYESAPDRKGLITVGAGYGGGNIFRVSIRDTGDGIELKNLKKIGKPFFTTKARGTGLGLLVCGQILRLHEGRMEIKSEKGKGTCVTVNLPVGRKPGGGSAKERG